MNVTIIQADAKTIPTHIMASGQLVISAAAIILNLHKLGTDYARVEFPAKLESQKLHINLAILTLTGPNGLECSLLTPKGGYGVALNQNGAGLDMY